MPEPEEAEGDGEVDEEPRPDPAEVREAARRLEVVGEEEVVCECDGEPDQVGAEGEEVPRHHLHPPAGRRHGRLLGGVAWGLVLDTDRDTVPLDQIHSRAANEGS